MKKSKESITGDLFVFVIISICVLGLTAVLGSCSGTETPSPISPITQPSLPVKSPSHSTSTLSSGKVCITPNDNWNLTGKDRCAFADTEWFQGLTIFKTLEEKITNWRFSRNPGAADYVYLAVVDSGGVNFDNGLKNIKSENRYKSVSGDLNIYRPWGLDFSHMHAVTNLVASDNDGNGMNGLASGILDGNNDKRLFLVLADHSGAQNYSTNLEKAVKPDQYIVSDIVLLSDYNEFYAENEWKDIVKIIADNKNVLFVIPALDKYIKLDLPIPLPDDLEELNHYQKDAYLGTLDNVVMVGGTSQCSPMEISDGPDNLPGSAYGHGIMIVAPFEYVPLADELGKRFPGLGNCFSAPQVASLAAVLKYIDPLLTPKQIKMLMIDSGWTVAQASEDKGNWYPVISFARAIAQAVIAQAMRYEPEIIKKLTVSAEPVYPFPADANGRIEQMPIVPPTGLIMSRICNDSIHYKVDNYGDHGLAVVEIFFDPSGPVTPLHAEGVISSNTFGFSALSADSVKLAIAGYDDFGLEIDYPINDSDSIGVSVNYVAAMSEILGIGKEGTITFKSCQIHDRYSAGPFSNAPWHVSFKGSIDGTLEIMDVSISSVIDHANIVSIEDFRLPFQVQYNDFQLCTYLEQQCAGGFGECMMTANDK